MKASVLGNFEIIIHGSSAFPKDTSKRCYGLLTDTNATSRYF